MQRLSFPVRPAATESASPRSARTRLARIGVATGVAGVALFGTMLSANAQTTTNPAPAPTAKTPLTQAQLDAAKACMTAKGFTVQVHDGKGRGAKGTTATTIAGTATTTPTTKVPKTAQTADQRAAYVAAATACGLPAGGHVGGPGRGGHGGGGPGGGGPGGGKGGRGGVALTDAQKACLTGKGITLPTAPVAGSNTTGTKPVRVAPTEAARAARKAAETACGIVRPTPPVRGTSTTPTTVKAV